MNLPKMVKLHHHRAYLLTTDKECWTVDMSEWYNRETGCREWRVHRFRGSTTTMAILYNALTKEAENHGVTHVVVQKTLSDVVRIA